MSERRGNPFGWILLGFIIGVLATFGTILVLSTSDEAGYEDGPAEVRTAADDALADAMASEARPRPRTVETVAPPESAMSLPAPGERPPAPTEPLDPQVADDAAAAGMTSRTR